MSSSIRDEDNNSALDRYEARLNKKDEALATQNKVSAYRVVDDIERKYGPFSKEEIEHYRRVLAADAKNIMNELQVTLVGYMFYKDFGDPTSLNSIRNQTDYIKLVIAAKRKLLINGMRILPYIVSGKVLRTATRKSACGKKHAQTVADTELEIQINNKYRNEKIDQKREDLVNTVLSSEFQFIDYDNEQHKPSDLDGRKIPMIVDIIREEMQIFVNLI